MEHIVKINGKEAAKINIYESAIEFGEMVRLG